MNATGGKQALELIPYKRHDVLWLKSHLGDHPLHDKGKALSYLRSGRLLVCAPGVEYDVILGGESRVLPSLAIQSDGTWAWASHLAYWVENYDFCLPEQFLHHARSREWLLPESIDCDYQFSDTELAVLADSSALKRQR